MPGRNCAVFGCGSCRRSKGIGIFKLPIASDESNCKWREAWLSEITKTRMMDQDFRNQITNDRVYTCEKHFNPEDIEIFHAEKMTKKKPRFGALPLLNMPRRSHESSKPPERRSIVRDVKPIAPVNTSCYRTFEEFCHRAKSLKSLSGAPKYCPTDLFSRKWWNHISYQSWKLSWTTVLDSL